MSDFSYTDAQVREFARAAFDIIEPPQHATLLSARDELNRLSKAGIRVTFPKPRFYVDDRVVGGGHIHVRDRQCDKRAVATFVRLYHPVALDAAHAEADRLNREVSS